MGDIRYTFAVENKNKVSNIVNNNLAAFDEIYLPLLQKLRENTTSETIKLKQK